MLRAAASSKGAAQVVMYGDSYRETLLPSGLIADDKPTYGYQLVDLGKEAAG